MSSYWDLFLNLNEDMMRYVVSVSMRKERKLVKWVFFMMFNTIQNWLALIKTKIIILSTVLNVEWSNLCMDGYTIHAWTPSSHSNNWFVYYFVWEKYEMSNILPNFSNHILKWLVFITFSNFPIMLTNGKLGHKSLILRRIASLLQISQDSHQLGTH